MAQSLARVDRRTNADDVFDCLHGEIVSLRLLPGTWISEIEVAGQFDVSRQPVREAFIRFANQDLLLIRPHEATPLHDERLRKDLEEQQAAMKARDVGRFHALDHDFHGRLCDAGDCALMSGTIAENKAAVDRI